MEETKMKKMLAVFCSAVFAMSAVGMAACNTQQNSGEGGKTSADPLPVGIVFDEKSGEMYYENKDGKSAIKITYSSGNGHEWIRKSASSFLKSEEGKDYYFELTVDDSATSSMSSKLEAGSNLDDIYFLLASPWQSYASLDQLENLDDLYNMTIPGEEGTVLDKITGTWKSYGKAINHEEEHFYIFPASTCVTGIVYNKTMFDEWGWTVPQTVAELETLCEKIYSDTNGAIKPFVYPGTVGGGYWDFVGQNWWLQASGVEKLEEFMKFESYEVFNPDPISSPSYGKYTMLQTFEDVLVKNKVNYIFAQSPSFDHLQAQQAFGLGQAAMIPNGSWIQNESGEDIEDEIRMMPVPFLSEAKKDENGEYIAYNYSGQPDFVTIPKAASNKNGAKLFLAYMCRDDMLVQYTETSGTPRPFEYDVTGCNVNDFQRSCLDIWENSTTWFESSSSPLWTGLKVRKFNAVNPYTSLITNYPKTTADSWCASEYAGVKGAWDSWQ